MTLSYAKGSSSVALLDQTIGENLRRTVERFPDREALVVPHQGYRATYAELWEQVDRAARALLARGVRPGDRVGIWARNRHEWVVTQFATARIGAILVTINPAYRAAELDYALRKAGVSLLVMADGPLRPDCARHDRPRGATGTSSWPAATGSATSPLAEREAPLAARRRDQHPVHVGHDGRAQGRDADATATSSTTPTSPRGRWATRSATASSCPSRSTTRSGW